MNRKEGFCESCQQNKPHRRVAGVFSLINLLLLGIPSLFGISTWGCTHCRSTRILLLRQREVSKKIPTSSFRRVATPPPPNGGLKPVTAQKVESTRSRLYSEKYRDGVVKRIVARITSIKEVQESLELPESDVVDWIKQSFQRKEDRVEMLRESLMLHKKVNPDFDVEQVVSEASEILKERPPSVEPSAESSSTGHQRTDDQEPIQRTFNRTVQFLDSAVPNEG